MNSVCPKCAKYRMMCHSTGRLPIGIIGLGSDWLSARMRMPEPAAEQNDLHDVSSRQVSLPVTQCREAARRIGGRGAS